MFCPKVDQTLESYQTIACFHGENYGLSAATTTASAAVEHATSHEGTPFRDGRNLYYSLWNYSADRSNTDLQVQPRRRRSATRTAEECFGQALRESRKARGLTQEELAFQSGYHPTYIGQLERGVKSPSLRTIMGLAAVLSTRASELIKRVEDLLQEDARA